MPMVNFYFTTTNLNVTAKHLMALAASPTQGQTIAQVENQLVTAAVNLFQARFGNQQSVSAQQVNDGILHAAVLWKGIGAVYSANASVSGGGVLLHQANVNVPISGHFVVCVDLWAYLD